MSISPAAHHAMRQRRGFTLVEFTISSLIVSILMAGLVSCIHMMTRAAQLTDGPTSKTSDAARLMELVITDLRLAQVFTERSSSAVEFTVPDRDGDGAAESVRYQWAGDPAFELKKTMDYSLDASTPAATTLATDVRAFDLEYLTKAWGALAPLPEIESDEVLLAEHDLAPWRNLNRVLFVVADSNSLLAQEAAKLALLQGWGFSVERISGNATQSQFNAAAARNDAVYVSSTAPASVIGTKLRVVSIGVVNEEPALADELGFSASGGTPSTSDSLDDTVGTHHIVRGLVPGKQAKLFSSAQPMQRLSNNTSDLSTDIQVLGRCGGQASLALLEPGAELYRPPAPAQYLGETSGLSNDSDEDDFPKVTIASRFELTTDASAISMSAYLKTYSAREIRFGIYSDAGGNPGTLVAETPAVLNSQNGRRWFTINFDKRVLLPAGTYWIAVGMQNDVEISFEYWGGTSRHAYTGADPRDGMMPTWNGTYGFLSNGRRYSIAMSYYPTAIAKARRIQLPWGHAGLDIQSLNDEGQGLMRRAVAWATEDPPAAAGAEFAVTQQAWTAQYVAPELPTNATGWQITRVFVRLRRPATSSGGSVWFAMAHANTTDQPSNFVLQQTYAISAGTWPSDRYQWYEVPFSATRDLPPDGGVCIGMGGISSAANAYVNYDVNQGWMSPGTHMVDTANAGSNWSSRSNARDLRYYVYGKYFTKGDPEW